MRRLLVDDIVHWIDQAAAEKVRPGAIDSRSRKERIVARRDPGRHRQPERFIAIESRLRAIEEASADHFLLAGNGDRGVGASGEDRLTVLAADVLRLG